MYYMIHGKNDETFQQFENALDPIKITSKSLVMNATSQEQIQKPSEGSCTNICVLYSN